MAPDIDSVSYPHRSAEYTYRVPTPPRIVVPPPCLNPDAAPNFFLNSLRTANFLNGVNISKTISHNSVIEWSYERRREAQAILPYLYLGPMTVAKDERFLRGETGMGMGKEASTGGITMVLGIRQKHTFESKLMNGVVHKAQELGVEAHTIDLASNQDLIHSFPQTTALIDDHLTRVHHTTGQLGKVLVFCESGNERSAGVVAAYLMATHKDLDFIKAIQLVQAQRFCANFDDALKRLLQGYWDILRAQREVAAYQSDGGLAYRNEYNRAGNLPLSQPTKRTLDRSDDDDMESDGTDDDMARFGGRTFAPFVDQSL